MSVTVVNPSSMMADALSTAAFVLRLEKGTTFLENFSDTDAIFVTKEKEVYVSKKLKDNFSIVEGNGNFEFYYY